MHITCRGALEWTINGKSEKIGFFNNPIVYPGAEIIIIEKPEKVAGESGKFLDDFVKIFGILSGTLTTVILTTKLLNKLPRFFV